MPTNQEILKGYENPFNVEYTLTKTEFEEALNKARADIFYKLSEIPKKPLSGNLTSIGNAYNRGHLSCYNKIIKLKKQMGI